MINWPCNCGHLLDDHTAYLPDADFHVWPVDNLCGECDCEYYTAMDNLKYLEALNDRKLPM